MKRIIALVLISIMLSTTTVHAEDRRKICIDSGTPEEHTIWWTGELPSGAEEGVCKDKITICHNGHDITVGKQAARHHIMNHKEDHVGTCSVQEDETSVQSDEQITKNRKLEPFFMFGKSDCSRVLHYTTQGQRGQYYIELISFEHALEPFRMIQKCKIYDDMGMIN